MFSILNLTLRIHGRSVTIGESRLCLVRLLHESVEASIEVNRSGRSLIWAPQNVGSLAFPKHLGSFLGISLPFCMHSY